jgi:outer membrane lipoprotein SlyB
LVWYFHFLTPFGFERCYDHHIVEGLDMDTKWLGVILCVSLMAGCANPGTSGSVYRADEAGREQTVRFGVVESVRSVTVEKNETGVGAISGAAVGGIAGSSVGKGRGEAVGAVVGAVAGGIAGQALERQFNRQSAQEISIKLANGEMVVIVQAGEEEFRAGDQVRLINASGRIRVTRR